MVNGKPTCANAALNRTLRETWGFQGYVTSDSDSCACIYSPHKYAPSSEAAARDCLAGGTDIDSGWTYTDQVARALNDSTIASRATVRPLLATYQCCAFSFFYLLTTPLLYLFPTHFSTYLSS